MDPYENLANTVIMQAVKDWRYAARGWRNVPGMNRRRKGNRTVIAGVEDPDEQMALHYRYIHNMTWEQIGDELNADASTVRRRHGKALLHVTLPEDPVVIEKL